LSPRARAADIIQRMTRMGLVSRVALVVVMGHAGVAAQGQWLPPQVQQGLAEQLAGRLASIETGGEASRSVVAEQSRRAVTAIGGVLGSWTDAVVISKAPSFSQLTMPSANEPALQAMAAYQMCTMTQFMRFESGTDASNRRATILGLTATTMAVLRLRQPFLESGGTMERVEAFLTSDDMAALLKALQTTPALMTHVEQQCQPIVRELVSKVGAVAP